MLPVAPYRAWSSTPDRTMCAEACYVSCLWAQPGAPRAQLSALTKPTRLCQVRHGKIVPHRPAPRPALASLAAPPLAHRPGQEAEPPHIMYPTPGPGTRRALPALQQAVLQAQTWQAPQGGDTDPQTRPSMQPAPCRGEATSSQILPTQTPDPRFSQRHAADPGCEARRSAPAGRAAGTSPPSAATRSTPAAQMHAPMHLGTR